MASTSSRVGIIGLLQESNTFLAEATTLEHFRQGMLLEGEAIRERLAGDHHEVGGFFAELAVAGVEAVPIFFARALPFGAMTAETYAALRRNMLARLAEAGTLDGVLVACHGANVAEGTPDVDGDWLSAIRRQLGPEKPLIATLDPHGNLSPQMVAATDALLAYRTNPHLDQRQCGLDAGRLLVGALRGEVRPTQAACFPPVVINIELQDTDREPLATHFRAADRQLDRPGVLSNSIMLGFPYSDVAEMGCAAIAVTDGDPRMAQELAAELAQGIWDDRQRFVAELLGVEEAVNLAGKLTAPVCLLDMGDNVGGGSPADSTVLLHAIRRAGLGPATACLFDPAAVERAAQAGVAATLTMAVGGKSHGMPLEAEFRVAGLYDGRFRETQPRHGGYRDFDQGPTAVVTTAEGLTLLLNSRRMAPFSLEQLRSCGLDPAANRILIAKGVHAPVAAYREVCREFLRVNTPGVTTAELASLPYRHRRRPLFPLEQNFAWKATS